MKIINKKLLMSLSVLATPFVVESITENEAKANQYSLTESVNAYGTAQNAAKQTNASKVYEKGIYYVYKQHNGMINISKTPGKAGAWINPAKNKQTEQVVTTASTTTKSKQKAPETKLNVPNVKATTYTLNNDVKTYSNAATAKVQKEAKSTYKSGNYYIFKEYNGMMNISKTFGKAGAWINPIENKAIIAKDKSNSVSQNNEVIKSSSANKTNNSNKIVNNPAVLTAGSQYILGSKTKVYSSAVDAKNGGNSKNTYNQGQYYIYKTYNGMINISRVKGRAGAWINPANNPTINSVSITPTKVEPEEVKPTKITKTVVGDLSKYSDKRFSWSWNYPSAEGLRLLKTNNGLYKYNTSNREVYLTFDNGYEAGYTANILNTLRKNNVKAVFFVTGDYIRDNLNLVKRMEAEGHTVANHTLRHYDASKVNAWTITKDIKDWETAYIKYMGKTPTTDLYRPATGTFSERTIKGAQSHGYKLVQWSYAYRDWDENNQPAVASSRNNLIKNSKPGDIILLHSVSRTNRDLLDGYIKEMKSRGFEFKQVK